MSIGMQLPCGARAGCTTAQVTEGSMVTTQRSREVWTRRCPPSLCLRSGASVLIGLASRACCVSRGAQRVHVQPSKGQSWNLGSR